MTCDEPLLGSAEIRMPVRTSAPPRMTLANDRKSNIVLVAWVRPAMHESDTAWDRHWHLRNEERTPMRN